MKLWSVSFVCILSGVIGCNGSTVPPNGTEKERARQLYGTWVGDTEVFGKPGGSIGHKWTITAEKIAQRPRVVFDGTTLEESSATQESTYTLDPAKSPATIDLTPLGGPNKGKTLLGIYQLHGDILKICISLKAGSQDRPTEFSTKQGSATMLFTLKRDK